MRAERETPPSALDWPARAGQVELLLQELTARAHLRRRRRTRIASAVALLAIAALGSTVAWRLQLGKNPAATEPAPALVARSTQQVLPDGSRAELKDGAQLTTDFSGRERRVELTRGTAHFQVNKNPDRPFVVNAGGVAVRAVGTAFSVEFERGLVEVLVTEGRVAVESLQPPATAAATAATTAPASSAASAASQLATIDAGAGVVLEVASVAPGAAPIVRPVPAQAIAAKLSWRARQLELSATPLADVVAMLNRHAAEAGRAVRFSIADPEIETVQLSGVIRTDKTDALVHLLEAECGVRAERRSDGQIILRKAR